MRYCFFTTGDWEANASLVRVRELGNEMVARGIDVSYVVDDFPYNREKLGVNAKASVAKKTVRKMLNIPRCAYCVQISTTFLLSVTDAFSTPSSRMFALINSPAR